VARRRRAQVLVGAPGAKYPVAGVDDAPRKRRGLFACFGGGAAADVDSTF
jgi:hypothetical protein